MYLQRPPFENPTPSISLSLSNNPLDDLVESEKEYISDLRVLLQRVSAGWTSEDFPPKEVDVMLRDIEEIHSVNRQLSKRLNDILETGNVTRELGLRHLDNFERGVDEFNSLESAFMRIDAILRLVTVDVPGTSRHPASPALSGISNMSTLRNALPSPPISSDRNSPNFPPQQHPVMMSPGLQPQARMSPALPPSPMSPGMNPQSPRPPQSNPINLPRTAEAMMQLERSLDTSKVMDLFTMQPKACSLSLALVEREVLIRGTFCFTISAEQALEDRFEDGHIILLSDLLLICRTKTQQEIESNQEGDQSTFWLLFPPLAIRHVIARDATQPDQIPIVELTIVNKIKSRIWVLEEQTKAAWIHEITGAQQRDSAKASQNQQQSQLNRSFTQNRPMRPMGPMGGPGSPLSPNFNGGPPPQQFNNGPMSPPFPGMPGSPMMGSMRRTNTMGGRPGAPRGRILERGDVAAAKEVMYKSKPCDVFQWREDAWEPLVEEDDCLVELRLTVANRLAMAVITYEQGQLVLNAWVVGSTTFTRSSETDISVSFDMGASVQWFLVAVNTSREADEFCAAFQRVKDRALYDPSLPRSGSPVLSRGDSLASTVMQKSAREKPVKQTLNTMYPPAPIKLLLQAGDHGQWISLGSARVEIKMEKPSGHVRLFVSLKSGNKSVLDSVIVQCDCLELVGPKKLAITLMNPKEKMSIIYMLQFKDEAIATKIFDALSLNESE
ncbi:hypothetical protein BGZ49_004929 [Haplosporangium sp. Z 27]|nr:hypothetical protein BGZ49_004929 [Haplosporangium sp. Z 27]